MLGSSHANTMRRALATVGRRGGHQVAAAGIGGARLGSARDRQRLAQIAEESRAEAVLLILGGNDLCERDVDLRELAGQLIELGEAVRGAGARAVYFFPVLPRRVVRRVPPELYETRRAAANRIWASRFRGPPVTFINMPAGADMIGRDGVHLSGKGQRVVLGVVENILRREA